ncbi:MAG TPA: hypothetical protein VL832_00075 [Puia sp.]|jgi:hypothetical protein|nr:hypothetical protein [Puia sp.]
MRQDLKHRLITWKNDTHFGQTKKVFVSESPVKKGEFIIKLEKSTNASLAGKINEVKATKKYLTAGQNDTTVDAASDLYTINRIIDSLDREFDDKYDQAINEKFKDEAVHFSEL